MAAKPPRGLVKKKDDLFKRTEKRARNFFQRLRFPLLIQLVVCLFIIVLHLTYLTPQNLQRIEGIFFDLYFRIRPPLEITEKVAYIEISEDSIQSLGRWPWPRHFHAVMTHILSEWEARAVVFDIVFSEPSTDFDDGAFEEALKAAAEKGTEIYFPVILEPKRGHTGEYLWIRSLPQFEKYAADVGHINIEPDIDGNVRRVAPFKTYEEETYPHLALKISSSLMKERGDELDYSSLKLDHEGDLIINWTGKWQETFDHYSYVDIMKSFETIKKGNIPLLNPQSVKGKVCFIGMTATGHLDIKATPIESSYPAVGVYGNLLNGIMNKKFIQPIADPVHIIVILLIGIICIYAFIPFRNFISLVSAAAMVLGWLMFSFFLFVKAGLWVYVFQQVNLILSLFIFTAIYDHFFVSQEKMKFFQLATRDGLTGLFVIRYFRILLNKAFDRALQNQEPISVILMDIDNFKSVNDTYGHQMGDEVLKAVSKIVEDITVGGAKSHESAQYVPGRYGGEEIIVLLKNTDKKDAAFKIAEPIRKAIEAKKISYGGKEISVTVSMGIGVIHEYETVPDIMVRRADEALYLAKSTGKNKVCLENE